MTNSLDKKEKKLREVNQGLHVAKTEKAHLTEGIRMKEDQIKLNEINLGPISTALTKESAK